MFAKTIEFACLGMVAIPSLGNIVPPSWIGGISAVGLIGFMVAQNYGQQKRLGRALDKKDQRIKEMTDKHEAAYRANTAAYEKLVRTLEHRPCLVEKDPSVRT